jgi:MFS family permease
VISRLLDLPLWRPLRDRLFRRLFYGEGLAVLADQMFLVALTLLVLRIAGPGLELGSVLAAASVPGAVFMLFGGWVADRFPPTAVLVASNAGRALLMAVLAALVLTDAAQLWHLYALAGGLGVLDAFHYPASLSVVPSVVEKKRLGAANALVQGAEQVGGLIGPALAASSAALFGLGATFGAFSLMFLATSAVIFSVVSGARRRRTSSEASPDETPEDAASRENVQLTPGLAEHKGTKRQVGTGGIVEGVRYAWRDPLIRTMLFVLAAINLAAIGPLMVGGAALAETRLGGAGSLGVLLSASGGGSLVGLIAAGAAGKPRRRGIMLLGVTALLGVGLGTLGFVPGLLSASAVAAGMGVGFGYLGVVLVSWLQERIAPELRGRVMSLVVFCVVALDPVSYALAGALVGASLTLTFVAAGTLMLATTLLGGLSRSVWSFD